MDWYDTNGKQISMRKAEKLLKDVDARRIACDTVLDATFMECEVSTVFLVLDHRHAPLGPPVLWETMVFGGDYDMYQERYTSQDAAEQRHREIVERIKAGLDV